MEKAITIDEIKEYEIFKKEVSKLSYEDLVIIRDELMNTGNDNTREYHLVDSLIKQRFIGDKKDKTLNDELYDGVKEHLKKMKLEDIIKWLRDIENSDVHDKRLYELIRAELGDRAIDKSTKKVG